MAKYSFEFKKQIVSDYLDGKGGFKYLAHTYGIPDAKTVRTWVNAYKTFGNKGLLRSRKKETYTFEFKHHVVELYLTTEISYQELALSVGMNSPALIAKWVNDFRVVGVDALRSKKKGRKKALKAPNTPKLNEQSDIKSVDISVEHVKQLEDELLKLKIENAYLKELRRLQTKRHSRTNRLP